MSEIDYRNKGTLILTSLLEDLAWTPRRTAFYGFGFKLGFQANLVLNKNLVARGPHGLNARRVPC